VNQSKLTSLWTTWPCFQQINTAWARDPMENQRSASRKRVTSMSSKLELAKWAPNTGQRIPWVDRCQLSITWISNIKEVHGKPRLQVSASLYLVFGHHFARLGRRRRRRRAYAPTSNTASRENHEKIRPWVSFSIPYEYGAPFGGPSGGGEVENCWDEKCATLTVNI